MDDAETKEPAVAEQLRGGDATGAEPAETPAGPAVQPSRQEEAETWKPGQQAWPPAEGTGHALTRLESATWDAAAGRLTARGNDGTTLLVQPLGPATVRVTFLAPGTAAAPASFAVLPDAPAAVEPAAAEETDAGWAIPLAAGRLLLDPAGTIRWTRADGETIVAGTAPGAPGAAAPAGSFGWDAAWSWVWLERNPGAALFGAGERTGPLDRSETRMTFWATDVGPHHPGTDAMYQSIPVAVAWDPATGHSSGFFCDHPGLQRWDLGQLQAGALCISAQAPVLDLYLFAGPAMPDVLAAYTALTGRMALPPRWALGFQQSSWSYFPDRDVRDIAQQFRQRQLPGDVIYLDIDYMRGFRDFTFDPAGFPDPAGLCRDLADLGFRIVTILDPGVKRDRGYPVYDEMFRNQYYVKWPDGRPFVGNVWPGACVFPDFFAAAVRDWWAGLHTVLLDAGVAGIWDDMNEPAITHTEPPEGTAFTQGWSANTFPSSVVHQTDDGERPHGQVHSAYGLQMARATATGLDRLQPDARRFVLTRSGYAGVQRYAAVWTGDNQSWWEHLSLAVSMCQGLGLSGVAFVGTDIGGFNARCTGELYLRWLQFGALMPLARAHYNSHESGGQRQEPWSFGPTIEGHARAALELRYRLLPYLYSLFYEATQTGAPILRPLAWEFPRDRRGRTADQETLCGPALLVAPVTRPGQAAAAVYLPAGRWVHFMTGLAYAGGQDVLVPTPLEHFPLFVRGGSVIPLGESARNAADAAQTAVTLLACVPDVGAEPLAPFLWYEDNGADRAYEAGESCRTPLRCAREANGHVVVEIGPVTGAYRPPPRPVHLSVLGLDAEPLRVHLNGDLVRDSTWDTTLERLWLTLPTLETGTSLRVEIEP